jgi:iron complex outermembrane recepter protein
MKLVQCGVWIVGILPAIAAAQTPTSASNDNGATLETIIVTAQKRSEDIQSVPIAITAMSGQALTDAGATGITDIMSQTPGLQMNSANGFLTPSIRGIGTNAGGAGLENSAALYIDGVYIGSSPASLISLNDIASVDVLKGPQGTLFGRNATAGAILVQTVDPTQTPKGDISVGYANFDTKTIDADASGGLAKDLAADLFIHVSTQGAGYGTNLYDGQDAYRQRLDSNARSKWVYTPSDGTSLKVAFDYFDRYGNMATSARPVPGTVPSFGPPIYGSPWNIDDDTNPSDHLVGGGGSIQLNQDLSWATLTSITAYRASSFDTKFDADYTPTPALTIADVNLKDRQLTEEIDLKSLVSGPFQWVAGLYYYQERARYEPGNTVLGGPLLNPVFPLQEISIESEQKTYSYAGFFQAITEVAANTHLTLGARFTSEKRELEGSQEGTLEGGIPLGVLATADTSKTYTKPTWRIALDHKFQDDTLIYASYNRGFKSGGYNAMQLTDPPFEPEVLDAYETGFKSELRNGTVRFNGAIFFYNYHDIQVAKYEDGQLAYYNGAGARIYGTDMDAEIVLLPGFSISSGLSLLHDRFTSFPDALYEIPQPTGGSLPVTQSATGNRLPQTPDATFDVSATYDLHLAAGRLRFFSGAYYNSGWYGQPDNILHQSNYWEFNSSVAWRDSTERFDVQLWGKNLTNKAVATALTGTDYASVVQYAPPRTYGITVSEHF